MAQNAAKDNTINSVCCIAADVLPNHELYDYFWAEISKIKPSIKNLGSYWVGPFDSDFVNVIAATLAKKPDVVLNLCQGSGFNVFVQQANSFKLFEKTKTVTSLNLEGNATLPFGKDYPVGIQATITAPFWLDTPEMRSFTQEFSKRTQLYPGDLTLDYYISTLSLLTAIQNAGTTDTDKVIAAYENLTLENTPVGSISYNDYDHQSNTPLWYATSGYSPDYPIAIGLNMTKYQDDIYPTKDEIFALRGSINISVVLQGDARPPGGWEVPLTVKLFAPPVNVMTAIPSYMFNLTAAKSGSTATAQALGIPDGIYDVSVSSPGCLTNVKRGVVITGNTNIDLGTLLAGNANDDNKVSIQDFGILAAAFGKGVEETCYDARADFDRSGRVNITDFGLLAANYARNSPVEVP
jgi:hypothetical protein